MDVRAYWMLNIRERVTVDLSVSRDPKSGCGGSTER